MTSDYQQQIKEIFGTADLDELRELAKMLKINNPNPRNAGRKAQLTPDQIVEVLELHRKGIGNTEIAKQFGVSRQTIYKYCKLCIGDIFREYLNASMVMLSLHTDFIHPAT